MCLQENGKTWGWEHGSVGKVLDAEARGPSSDLQD